MHIPIPYSQESTAGGINYQPKEKFFAQLQLHPLRACREILHHPKLIPATPSSGDFFISNPKGKQEARKYIAELFKIVNTCSILVVWYDGKVKRLHFPFTFIARVDVPPLEKGGEHLVEAVKMTLQLEDVFSNQGKAYFVWYFAV